MQPVSAEIWPRVTWNFFATLGVKPLLGRTFRPDEDRLLAGRALETMLYQISPSDPATFATVPVLFAAVAMAACWMPARRAMAVNPVIALRYE